MLCSAYSDVSDLIFFFCDYLCVCVCILMHECPVSIYRSLFFFPFLFCMSFKCPVSLSLGLPQGLCTQLHTHTLLLNMRAFLS